MKIGVIGCGNMGQALIRGMLRARFARPGQIAVSDANSRALSRATRALGIRRAPSNRELAREADVVLLAVKPQQVGEVLDEIRPVATRGELFISIAAGITTTWIEKRMGGSVAVVRVMPNTPALVGEGMSAIALGRMAKGKDLQVAKRLFACVGEVVQVPERWMNAVTATSGSGPAYFFALMEEMIEVAVSMGLPRKLAAQLVLQTAVGAAKLAKSSQEEPSVLRARVTSKGGTTEAAFKVFAKKHLSETLRAGIKAAAKKAEELAC